MDAIAIVFAIAVSVVVAYGLVHLLKAYFDYKHSRGDD